MSAPTDEAVPWEPVATAAARSAMVRGWAIPLSSIPVVVGVPILLTSLTYNWMWLGLIPVLTRLVRSVVGDDQNRPRVLWLAWLSGQMFANRAAWGGDSRDPHDS
ncbi:MAG: hypothetical protein NVS1B6_01500 [Steroidobacteraceae bacterium]